MKHNTPKSVSITILLTIYIQDIYYKRYV